jgi:5-methylcytosine-specific restriction endonuclease McrA
LALGEESQLGKHGFTQAEKWGIYNTYDQKCYICSAPLDLKSMEVDHVLPESLLNSEIALSEVLRNFALPKEFSLNSFENWLPACKPCNLRKGSEPFRATPLIQMQMDRARRGAQRAAQIAAEVPRKRQISYALSILELAPEADLDLEKLRPIIERFGELYSEKQAAQKLHGDVPEFRIAPATSARYESTGLRFVHTPRGVGYVPTQRNPHSSFYCGSCGSLGPWNGATCLSCGMKSDGDC